MKILSVSVAAFNVEKFIRQNIESFLDTEVSDKIELLVVNDGSRDRTAEIAGEYQEKYPGIVRLINQENAGPGSTVNTALQHAAGKYFRMVDGDDWVDKRGLKTYLEFMEREMADVIYTDYCKVDHITGEQRYQAIDYENKNTVLKYADVCDCLDVSMHNVTYRTELLKENGFAVDNCFYTDMEYLLYPVKYLNTIAVLDCNVYMYRVSLATQSMNINSMVKNKAMHKLVFEHLLEDWSEFGKGLSATDSRKVFFEKKMLVMAGAHLSIILAQEPSRQTKEELREFIGHIEETDYDLYQKFVRLRTVSVLRRTHYLVFGLLSRYHRHRTGAAPCKNKSH